MAANAAKYILLTGGIAVLGFGIMKYTTPNKEELIKNLPDKSQLNETAKRNQELLEALEKSTKSNEPIWKLKPPPVKKQQ